MKLFENWETKREALLEGLTPSQKKIVAPLIENQKQHISETAAAGTTASTSIGDFRNIVIPMIRRIIPGTIATELVGVQAMSGPVGLAYSLRFEHAEALDVGGDGVTPNDIAAGDEIFGVGNPGTPGKTQRYYSGDAVNADPQTGVVGTGALTSDFEATGGRQVELKVLKQAIEAKSRKLQAKWTIEAMQDLNNQHGMDLESEITTALSAQVVSELDNEIITDLIELAGTVETFDMNGTFTGTPNYVGDRHAVLGTLISKVANEIARRTRRAQANWIVVSPVVATVLQSASRSTFAPAVQGSFEGPNNTKLIGTLNGSIKVYTYVYHDQGTEPVLVGYKGGNGEIDSGYFYCPYIPLMATPVITDPSTYNPQISLMTRYGKAIFTDTSTSLGQSSDYYGRVEVSNLTFV